MEFIVCYGDGEVGLLATARCKARKKFSVEKGNPSGARGLTPVKECEESAGAVIDAWILAIVSAVLHIS